MNPLHKVRSNPVEFMPLNPADADVFATSAELAVNLALHVSQDTAPDKRLKEKKSQDGYFLG